MNIARCFARRPASRKSRKSSSKRDFVRRGLMAERLETRSMLAGDVFISDFWNHVRPNDVNGDGSVSPIDALLVINQLNATGTRQVSGTTLTSDQLAGSSPEGEGEPGVGETAYYDVNNDGYISPLDSLLVINDLNAEGEPGDLLQYRIYVVNVGTKITEQGSPPTSITSIPKGEDYELVVTIQDLRSGAQLGPAAGFLDVFYDKSLTSVYVNEIQDIVISGAPTGGNFTLMFGGQTTTPITYDAFQPGRDLIPGEIDAKLEALSTIGAGNVEVVAVADGFRVRFVNNLGDQDVGNLTANGAGLTGGSSPSATVVQVADGVVSDPVAFEEAFRSRVGYPSGNEAYFRGQPLFNAGDFPDRIDDLGGAYISTDPPYPQTFERELARARMHADSAGTLTFTPSLADIVLPHHQSLLYADPNDPDSRSPVALQDIDLGPTVTLTITELISAINDPASVSEDSTAGVVINVLANDTKNAGAPAGMIELRSIDTTGVTGTVTIDNNGTPLDATDDQIKYVPAPNFAGQETFTYTIGLVDGASHPAQPTDTATVTVTVNPVNDPPVNLINGVAITPATPARTATEDTPFVFNAANSSLLSISDLDAGAATDLVTIVSVTNGTLNAVENANVTIQDDNSASVTLTGSVAGINAALNGMVFNPTLNFPFAATTGAAILTIATTDAGHTGSGGILNDADNLTINVTAVNDAPENGPAPTPLPGTQTMDESPETLTFSAANSNRIVIGDVDAGSDPDFQVILDVDSGTLNVVDTGNVTIQNDNTATVTVTGTLANINIALDGLVYSPTPAFVGNDTLTITSNDDGATGTGGTLQDVDQIVIVVEATVRPRARNDVYPNLSEALLPFGAVDLDVMDNDLAHLPLGDFETTLEEFSQPIQTGPLVGSRGTVSRNENGTLGDFTDDTLVYTPPSPDFFGTVTFTYTINDTYDNPADGNEPDADSTATVTLIIAATNDQPVANVDPAFATDEDTTLTTTPAQSLLNNDTDADNQFDTDNDGVVNVTNTLSAELVAGSLSPAGGSLTVNSDGTFSYTPPLDYNGPVTFQYRVNDGQGQGNSLSDPATVTINVAPINDEPATTADNYSVAEDGTLTADGVNPNPAGVLANDNDGDPELSQTLTAELVAGSLTPSGGAFNFNADGTFTYSPPADFNGQVTFQYRANDGQGANNLSDPTTVTINVTAVNDAPVAVDDSYTVTEDALLNADNSTPNRRSVTFNDTDVDSATINVSFPLVDLPDFGVLNMNANGTFTYQPNLDFVGTDTFQYRATDGSATSANIATVTITVTDANDAPVALPDSGAAFNINEDTTLNVAAPGVLGNDSDPDIGQTATLTAQLVPNSLSPANAGTLNLSANGAVQFTPAAHFFGTVTFQYQANDGQALPNSLSNVVTVTIVVAETNDPPNAVNDDFTAIKDFDDQVINVLGNDSLLPDTNPNEFLSVIGVSTTAGGPFTASASTAQGGTVSIVGGQVLYDSPPNFESGPLDTFFYRVSDNRPGGALTDDAQVSVEVLAFVPKIISGTVWVDSDNNGQIYGGDPFTDTNGNGVYDGDGRFVNGSFVGEPFALNAGPRANFYDPPEKRIAGVKVYLTGTDFLGNEAGDTPDGNGGLRYEAITDANGVYRFLGDVSTQFLGLKPGSYVVTEVQPNYLSDGLEVNAVDLDTRGLVDLPTDNRFTVDWGVDDFSGDVAGLNFGEGGISTASLTESGGLMQEALGSSGRNGLVINTSLLGDTIWSWAMPGWTNMSRVELILDAGEAHATLRVWDNASAGNVNPAFEIRIHQETAYNGGVNSPPAGSMARFRVLGRGANGEILIRLDGTAAEFGLNLLAAAPVAPNEAEGEPNSDRQYAEAADAVFADEAWA